ncbi:MAG: helix-turn-helix domain-containing protein [Cellulomonas sp.]|uniref:helix-turn-helix transcriptional regulator n=1 Tax=Cellulomonas sp. 73-92 TaxID=1895740 RepID=UPI00092ABB70|nr:helix-turn-helix domain-containing protein [Cellulomonas sp. 73-92]MBN9375044.1 helix-turn-helix domain-containing protein [Cellulomonas sp.]OJV84448.1 MAG: hypothetical protein BGO37_08510 [Cellulomonas sp. 73-92]
MELLTITEVAAELRVPVATVRSWRAAGRGPKSFKLPGARHVVYARADVEAFIEAGRNGVPDNR